MGMDAYVRCTCWKEGRVKPPPFPVYEDDEGNLRGYAPDFDSDDKQYRKLWTWMRDACEHANMIYSSVRVGNWWSYRSFQQLLDTVGWTYFPTLYARLPNSNDGACPAWASVRCLQELERLKTLELGSGVYLVNTATGEELYRFVDVYQGIFGWSGNLCLGFDRNGLFIREGERELFRALRLEQRISGEGDTLRVKYVNADTEARFVCAFPVQMGILEKHPDYPRLLHVAERRVTLEDYRYTFDALVEVFTASVETGNPVIWT